MARLLLRQRATIADPAAAVTGVAVQSGMHFSAAIVTACQATGTTDGSSGIIGIWAPLSDCEALPDEGHQASRNGIQPALACDARLHQGEELCRRHSGRHVRREHDDARAGGLPRAWVGLVEVEPQAAVNPFERLEDEGHEKSLRRATPQKGN